MNSDNSEKPMMVDDPHREADPETIANATRWFVNGIFGKPRTELIEGQEGGDLLFRHTFPSKESHQMHQATPTETVGKEAPRHYIIGVDLAQEARSVGVLWEGDPAVYFEPGCELTEVPPSRAMSQGVRQPSHVIVSRRRVLSLEARIALGIAIATGGESITSGIRHADVLETPKPDTPVTVETIGASPWGDPWCAQYPFYIKEAPPRRLGRAERRKQERSDRKAGGKLARLAGRR